MWLKRACSDSVGSVVRVSVGAGGTGGAGGAFRGVVWHDHTPLLQVDVASGGVVRKHLVAMERERLVAMVRECVKAMAECSKIQQT